MTLDRAGEGTDIALGGCPGTPYQWPPGKVAAALSSTTFGLAALGSGLAPAAAGAAGAAAAAGAFVGSTALGNNDSPPPKPPKVDDFVPPPDDPGGRCCKSSPRSRRVSLSVGLCFTPVCLGVALKPDSGVFRD